MYSYEDRIRAVKFYINCGYNAAYTVRKLGYPDVTNLKHWYREYSEFNDLHLGRKKVSKYSDKEKRDAVDYYFSHLPHLYLYYFPRYTHTHLPWHCNQSIRPSSATAQTLQEASCAHYEAPLIPCTLCTPG